MNEPNEPTVGLEPDGGYPILRLRRGEPVILELGDKSAVGEAFEVEVVLCGAHDILLTHRTEG